MCRSGNRRQRVSWFALGVLSVAKAEERDQIAAFTARSGAFLLTEPELWAALQGAEADGLLRCSICGSRLRVEEVHLLRKPLGHRWATFPVHRECRSAGDDLSLEPHHGSAPLYGSAGTERQETF